MLLLFGGHIRIPFMQKYLVPNGYDEGEQNAMDVPAVQHGCRARPILLSEVSYFFLLARLVERDLELVDLPVTTFVADLAVRLTA